MKKLFVLFFALCFGFTTLASPKTKSATTKPVAKQTVSTAKSDKLLLDKRQKKAVAKLSPKAQKGLKILSAQNLAAREDLRKKGLKSVNRGVKNPVDSVPADFAIRTVFVEHTAGATPKQVNKLLEKVADKPNALSRVKSPKKASGAVQLMPKTYASLVKSNPKAKLEKDFAKGTANNKNAMKALYLLADADRKCTQSKDVKIIAAAYNAGCTPNTRKVAAGKKGAKLPKETRDYLAKHKRLEETFGK